MKLAYKLFLIEDNEFIFGPGKWEILEAVKALGSLRQAALSLGMSYRWAWGRIRDLEKALDVELLIVDKNQLKSRAKILSPEGHKLLDWYDTVQKALDAKLAEIDKSMPEFLLKR